MWVFYCSIKIWGFFFFFTIQWPLTGSTASKTLTQRHLLASDRTFITLVACPAPNGKLMAEFTVNTCWFSGCLKTNKWSKCLFFTRPAGVKEPEKKPNKNSFSNYHLWQKKPQIALRLPLPARLNTTDVSLTRPWARQNLHFERILFKFASAH